MIDTCREKNCIPYCNSRSPFPNDSGEYHITPMTDSDSTAFSPGPNATPGVSPGELLGRALESKPLTGDPHAWQPPSPEALQAHLPGYDVQQFIARGGMGAVYRGVQTSLGRQVAIKILPPELRDADPHYAARFKQEARAMAQLNHPAIVSVYDFGEMPDGTFYFIMEFIDGTDVGQMVAQQGRLASAHAMAITAHVCDALQYAHERGIVHRDIKPANIMVGFDGRVKVADFGLAKSTRQVDTGLTQSGFVMGTPHFVAPEAMIMGVSIDHRADIYAVGVMLYQMLTGKVPQGLFEMPSLQVPGLDPRYDAIVSSAMRENRDQRYQHIIDMRRALDAIVTQPVQKSEVARQTVPATVAAKPAQQQRPTGQPNRAPQRSVPPPRVKEKSGPGTWLLAAAVVMILGGIAWMKMGNTGQPSTTPPVAESAVPAADSAKSSPMGSLRDLVFQTAPFQNATIPEVIEYLQIKSRDLDPSKQGITILADEATRNTQASISMDIKDARLADLIVYLARLARLEVSHVGDAIQLKISSLVKPPFPIGKPTEKLRQAGEAILPIMPFNKTTLEEACEYVRQKGRDVSGQHVNLLIDPVLTQQKHAITLDVTRVSISTALAYIADLCEAEVAYVGESFYLQPASTKPVQLDPYANQSFGEAGKIILPTMNFQNATIHEAVEYLVFKGRDLDPQKKGVVILLDEGAGRSARRIILDSQNITVANAVAQVATAAGLELYRVGEAARLRSPATAKQKPSPSVEPSKPEVTALKSEAENLLTNGSFESKDTSTWRLQGHREDKEAGSFEPKAGRNNSTAAVLRSKEINDIRFMQTVKVTPNTDYVVSGWLKTQGVIQEDGALRGAGLSILGGFEGTEPIGGDTDWTPVQFTVNSKDRTEVEICARLGFFGAAAKGTIWFDDLRMVRSEDVPATREKSFINTLGMKFVPVPGTKVLMCVHPTRVKDYQFFAKEHPTGNDDWQHPKDKKREYPASPDHAVTMANWFDANAFCAWLSKKEGQTYRLPSDKEWCAAAEFTLKNAPSGVDLLGYGEMPYPTVMNGKPNSLGIHDLGSMGMEWCSDGHPKWNDLKLLRRFIVERAGVNNATDLKITLLPNESNETDGDGPDARRPYTVFRCVLESGGAERPSGSSAAAIQTNKQLAPQSSTDRPIEVKLAFENAEKYFDVGGYQPIESALSKSAPRSISKAPAGLVSPLYGELKLGPAGSPRIHAIILNHSKKQESRLYVDSNANGDLTDDPPAKWQPGQQSNVATKAKWEVFQGEFMVELKHADGIHPARFEVFQNTSASSTSDSLWIHPQYGRVGSVSLGGSSFNALLYDDGGKGDFSAPSCTLRIDLNGDRAFRAEQSEVFPVAQPFSIRGVRYQLSGLTSDGVSFQIIGSNGGNPLPSAPNSPSSRLAPEYRAFTDTKGRTIRAALIRIQNDDVTLKREDGQEFAIKAAMLSQADIEYLKARGLAMSKTPAAAQVPTTAAAASSSPSRDLVIPEESKTSILQQTTIFGLSRTDASGILGDARFKTNPKSVLESVLGMVASKRATLLTNLSVSAKFGTRSRVEGSYGCESEIIMNADGGLKAMFAIASIRSPASPKLTILDVAAKRGQTLFLGSFDEDDADPKMPVRLVFVTFH